ncbi:methyltransferase domain-containing protein [Niastella caeni]|uniref:protein-glutamate O-methyltransferase n=1 Tax=Niastella caeni TaxID=2569763 RepID=A0A4S8HYP8_9BACT|nr:protein-glutamate O-methyltransferase [Niastella caeni]THU40800.1 methyltransferase domain-containing protein [Niastella caeni]
MTTRDFNRLSTYINNAYGIKMPAEKKVMLECRLQKRLTALHMSSYKEYCDFLFSDEGLEQEMLHMIDVVTTNKTDFFREPSHFEFLTQYALPELCEGWNGYKEINVWSAGCSSGEEVYTLAMVLNEFTEMVNGTSYRITGTDVSLTMLSKAAEAVYTEERIADIPMWLRKKYLLRSKDRAKQTIRINAALRGRTEFKRLNLMDEDYDVYGKFDVIFCRNVLIYFDKTTQCTVINKLAEKLKPGGYLFLGHSETVSNMQLSLVPVQPTILKKLSHQ